ncbi:hypothetical protein [Aureimonas sp. AU20]|nr:hypothetical protein [Aureimonas sp. AU20]ALN73794.1 hypothetical protein M673_13795 [Aureimonas sp. AU20]
MSIREWLAKGFAACGLEDARACLAFLKSEKPKALFRQQGFSILPTNC